MCLQRFHPDIARIADALDEKPQVGDKHPLVRAHLPIVRIAHDNLENARVCCQVVTKRNGCRHLLVQLGIHTEDFFMNRSAQVSRTPATPPLHFGQIDEVISKDFFDFKMQSVDINGCNAEVQRPFSREEARATVAADEPHCRRHIGNRQPGGVRFFEHRIIARFQPLLNRERVSRTPLEIAINLNITPLPNYLKSSPRQRRGQITQRHVIGYFYLSVRIATDRNLKIGGNGVRRHRRAEVERDIRDARVFFHIAISDSESAAAAQNYRRNACYLQPQLSTGAFETLLYLNMDNLVLVPTFNFTSFKPHRAGC